MATRTHMTGGTNDFTNDVQNGVYSSRIYAAARRGNHSFTLEEKVSQSL